MKLICCILLLIPSLIFAQTGTISGKVIDDQTKEPVIGAMVFFSKEIRVKSDIDGNYSLKDLPYGKHVITVSMFSYDTMYLEVNIKNPVVYKNIILGETQEFDEVEVIGQLAQDRKTPVAITSISPKKLVQELGSQDLPMILNSTPGVHATQTGGGDGDARITIRGFNQRNIGVLIDGVPVNDMETGAVYWSNWFGLDAITSQIQVQRGLGATKLALPSVGGTMNILTQGTGGKRSLSFKQEYGTGDFLRSSISYNSGKLKNGWGVLFSGSYKQGNGWVDGLYTQGAFYYLKVQKRTGKHLTSLSAFGAPQKHGQRSYSQPIEYWDKEYAERKGIDTTGASNYGLQHNQHYGTVSDRNIADYGNIKSERMNFYHKPQITLKDFWKFNDRFSWSNIAYASIGKGGGKRARNSSAIIYDEKENIDWDDIYRQNREKTLFGQTTSTADPLYDPVLLKSSQVLTASMNNHLWIGGISQFDFKYSDNLNFAGGLDYRWYKGEHYVEVVDLLGGDYFINNQDDNAASPMKVKGDKIGWNPWHNHRDGIVQWGGAFGQVEYEKGRWTAFANISGAVNSYKGIDYFQKKELRDGDTTIYVGANDTVTYNGKTYTNNSPELVFNQTETKVIPGGTFKAGANFNVTEKSNVFVNIGYLSRTPLFNNVVNTDDNRFFTNTVNEIIQAVEAGYGFRSKKFSGNINGYFTNWKNKPLPFGISITDPNDPLENLKVNIDGLDALHMGIEFDGVYKISKVLSVEGMISLGNWEWKSAERIDVLGKTKIFDLRGIKVGDAAQSMYGLSLKYNFLKRGYIKLQLTHFEKYYSDFRTEDYEIPADNVETYDLEAPIDESLVTQPWKIPAYNMLNAFAGYTFKIKTNRLSVRAGAFNILNAKYISDARNNQAGTTDFDANSAQVFFGQGFRFNLSLTYQF